VQDNHTRNTQSLDQISLCKSWGQEGLNGPRIARITACFIASNFLPHNDAAMILQFPSSTVIRSCHSRTCGEEPLPIYLRTRYRATILSHSELETLNLRGYLHSQSISRLGHKSCFNVCEEAEARQDQPSSVSDSIKCSASCAMIDDLISFSATPRNICFDYVGKNFPISSNQHRTRVAVIILSLH
jgi:hypothetical protein